MDFEGLMKQTLKAQEIYDRLKTTDSMSEVSETVTALDESTAKMVLKMFVYAQ